MAELTKTRVRFLYCLVFFNFFTTLTSGANWKGRVILDEDFNKGMWSKGRRWAVDNSECQYVQPYDSDDTKRQIFGTECFDVDNVWTDEGNLILKVERNDTSFSSARVRLLSPNLYTYGTISVKVRMPKGNDERAKITLIPTDEDACRYERIDILDVRSEKPSTVTVGAAFGRNVEKNMERKLTKAFSGDLSKDYHEFTLVWHPTRLQWFMDGRKFYDIGTHFISDWVSSDKKKMPCPGSRKLPIFAREFQIVASLETKGTRGSVEEWEKPILEIDYVKVYQGY